MWNNLKKVKKRYLVGLQALVVIALVISLVFAGSIHIKDNQSSSGISTIGIGQKVITIGTEAYAIGTADYSCDGVADDVQFQAAINALPAGGGKLVVLAGIYNFSATVTRIADNISIEGVGRATYFIYDGVSPLFTAGGNNWVFSDLRTDAGSINMGVTTGWSWANVTIVTNYYAYRTPMATTTGSDWEIPTGRGTTLVVAASNASAISKAQADYVCDGVADEIEINAAILALSTSGGIVKLSEGVFILADSQYVSMVSNIQLIGSGKGTVIERLSGGAVVILAANISNFAIKDLTVDGNKAVAFGIGDPRGISIAACSNFIIDDVTARNTHKENIEIYESYLGNIVNSYFTNGTTGLRIIDGSSNITVSDCMAVHPFSDFGGLEIYIHPGGDAISGISVSNFVVTGGRGIEIYGDPGGNQIIGVTLENCVVRSVGEEYAILMGECRYIQVIGGYYEGVVFGTGITTQHISVIGATVKHSNTVWPYSIGIDLGGVRSIISNNHVVLGAGANYAIYTDGGNSTFIDGNFAEVSGVNDIIGIQNADAVRVFGNHLYRTGTGIRQIRVRSGCTNTDITYNHISTVWNEGTGTVIRDNIGYIANGEVRSASGSLVAGNANVICFAWHNPELQDIFIKKVVVEVTTGGGTVGAHLDAGIADDATGTNRGTEFFNDLLLNNIQIDDSWVAGDGGTQTKWVFCQDSASATGGWIVGQILDANAASLVGKYYIEYIGR